METRKDYEETVKGPGKFEGEQAYVPYLWNMAIDGYFDGFGDVGSFGLYCVESEINTEDIEIFPELLHRKKIFLCENSQGFVSEMSKAEYNNTEKAYDEFMESTEEV